MCEPVREASRVAAARGDQPGFVGEDNEWGAGAGVEGSRSDAERCPDNPVTSSVAATPTAIARSVTPARSPGRTVTMRAP
ncbi:hypothetical protein GLX30_32750 [Streptomyces sp. Tu 2975]|uniref:hypothetical protein n=1 Tax=Streptomyces sp. Tu 2975 TaxID=2676871 RepID=UPI0013576EE4|nr:hypothetical protein [Streptomyces sp. Tu 2975]QIP88000.1 hypothetical protein GLX30_32750 [Streptomyces sp. Tu 2975]